MKSCLVLESDEYIDDGLVEETVEEERDYIQGKVRWSELQGKVRLSDKIKMKSE